MQKELLSAYIDGEHVSNEFTTKLCQNAELQASWHRYHAIRSVMREETSVFLGTDFTAKMEALIEAEPTMVSQPTPEEAEQLPFVQKLKAMFAPLTQIAVAAAVCLVAVLGVQTYNAYQADKAADLPVLQTTPILLQSAQQPVSYNAPMKDVTSPEKLEQKNKRMGAMLQHYEMQRKAEEAQK